MSSSPPMFREGSELREFFRTNQTPIYLVSSAAFNLPGIDRWARNGTPPVPQQPAPPTC